MSRTVVFLNVISILFIMIFLLSVYRLSSESIDDLREYTLKIQVDNASDAAVEELLYSANLEQDYNTDAIMVQPDVALREFSSILASSLGYAVTDDTIQEVQHMYMKVLLVCAWDGVYAYYMQPSITNESRFVSTPKLPYYYTQSPRTSVAKQYALNLGLKKGYCDEVNNEGSYRLNNYDVIDVPLDVQRTAINNKVSDVLQWALNKSYERSQATSYFIPAYASEVSGAQPVDGVTVIGIVDGRNSERLSSITAMGIGGSKIEENDQIVGFTYNGVKYYLPQSKMSNNIYSAMPVQETFDDVFEAAKAGYHCVIKY